MPIRIPEKNKKLSQTNQGITGNLAGTFNMDFSSNKGRMMVAGRGEPVQTVSLSTARTVSAIVPFSNGSNSLWASIVRTSGTADGVIYHNSSNLTDIAWTQDATTGSPTNLGPDTDMKSFSRNGTLYVVTGTTTVNYLTTSGSWSTFAIGISAKTLCEFQNRMYAFDGTSVVSWDTSNTVAAPGAQYTTTVLAGLGNSVITGAVATQDAIFISVNINNNKGVVYVWDGINNASATASTGFSQIIPLSSYWPLAMVARDNIPYVLTANGFLSKYTGATFQEVARLPYSWKAQSVFCHKNGMTVHNGMIHMNVGFNFTPGSNTGNEYGFDGVWCFDEDIGLYHKVSPAGSSGSTSTMTDSGQMEGTEFSSGALATYIISTNSLQDNLSNGVLVFGSKTALAQGIFVEVIKGTSARSGFVVTQEIDATDINSTWSYLFLKHSPLWSANSKIYAKYRTVTKPSYEYAITFGAAATDRTVSVTDVTSTFHSTFEVGDEFMGVTGYGSGMCAHIKSISGTSTPYTVTLDEPFTGISSSSAGSARFTNWKKLTTRDGSQATGASTVQSHQYGLPINSNDTKVQIKIYVVLEQDDSTALTKVNHLFTLDEIALVETEEISIR